MGRITRRALLAVGGAALAAPLTLRYAHAAQFNFKIASELAPSHPVNLRLGEAADLIRKDSDGKIDIQIFPNNQLGGSTDMLNQVRSGALEFFIVSPAIISSLVPVVSINSMGFAFKNIDQVWQAMDGKLGELVRARIAASTGLIAQERIWDNGFRQVTCSTKPINGVGDVAGLKIRVPVSPLYTSMWKSLGALPASINYAEVYSSLQTRIVDAQENPLALIYTSKFFEVQKYCSLTNHMWDGQWLLTNKRVWERLPADLRDLVAKRLNEAALRQRADVAHLNSSLQDDLKKANLVFNTVDPSEFRATLQKAGFYADWKSKYGDEAWNVLEGYTGALG